MTEPVLYDVDQGVATITLNMPERRNPVSDPATIAALIAALDRVQEDRGVRVAILTGAGSAFSSGGDVKNMLKLLPGRASQPIRTPPEYRRGVQQIPLALGRIDVPVIAAVNGPAMGAGLDLACMCDIRIAAQSASFGETFVKVGLLPADGGAWFLQRVIGYAKAAEMALTGDVLDAASALSCGLVSAVVPDAELMAAARRLAGRIAANPPDAVRMTRRLMLVAREASLHAVLDFSAQMQALAHTSPDHAEAVAAFNEKRRPRFTTPGADDMA